MHRGGLVRRGHEGALLWLMLVQPGLGVRKLTPGVVHRGSRVANHICVEAALEELQGQYKGRRLARSP